MLAYGNKRLDFVCQTGGNNVKAKWRVQGLESMAVLSIIHGRLPLTRKGIINIFDIDTKKWLGYLKYENENSTFPQKFKADEELYFNDFYTEGK